MNNTSNGNVALHVGSTTTTVEVGTGIQVNTEQATVQGVITTIADRELCRSMDGIIWGWRGLSRASRFRMAPVFDPTKNGYSSISFGGRYGRTARVEVDGGDISDENVGTVTMNVPASAIQEFQIEQSSLDLSSGMTSSGAVNVSTRSGTNGLHGEGFYAGRCARPGRRVSRPKIFFSGASSSAATFGGPIKKDKVFFFIDYERSRQDYAAPMQLRRTFRGPFRYPQPALSRNTKLRPHGLAGVG